LKFVILLAWFCLIPYAHALIDSEGKAQGHSYAEPKGNDPSLTVKIVGAPAALMYQQLKYGNAMQPSIPAELPKDIQKGNFTCGWKSVLDDGFYVCSFTVDKDGIVSPKDPSKN
jgi:hypothetical protein